MKKVLMIFLNLFTSIVISAQSIPIQLLVADANGFEKINTQVKLRLTLRNDTSSSSGQYTEVHTTLTNEFGIVSVNFGEGIPTSNSKVMGLEGFNFSVNEPFIKTELDTSLSPSNYYSFGWLKYSYPMVAQRALHSDSASYSIESIISTFSDSSKVSFDSYTSIYSDSSDYAFSSNNALYSDTSNYVRNLNNIENLNELLSDFYGPELITLANSSNIENWWWKTSDSNYYYGWSDNTLFYASKNNPDVVYNKVYSFPIHRYYPADSIAIGISPLSSNQVTISASNFSKSFNHNQVGYTNYTSFQSGYFIRNSIHYKNGIIGWAAPYQSNPNGSIKNYREMVRWYVNNDSLYREQIGNNAVNHGSPGYYTVVQSLGSWGDWEERLVDIFSDSHIVLSSGSSSGSTPAITEYTVIDSLGNDFSVYSGSSLSNFSNILSAVSIYAGDNRTHSINRHAAILFAILSEEQRTKSLYYFDANKGDLRVILKNYAMTLDDADELYVFEGLDELFIHIRGSRLNLRGQIKADSHLLKIPL